MASDSNLSLPDQRVVATLDWLHTALIDLENAVCEISPDANTASLQNCRCALRHAGEMIATITDLSSACQVTDYPTLH